jgi:NAD(P)-dependent dehydrogenase (short-subunit alcohol dehydrogenase family)
MRAIDGMSILITGGGSGIGADCARRFCEQGARVTITGRRIEKLQRVQAEIGEQCHIIQGDVTREEDRIKMLETCLEHGGGRLDALVNNAANMYRQPVDQYSEAFLKEAFETNVISAMMLSSIAVTHLEKTAGAIVFIGSTHTKRAFPGASPYATTKAALEGLSKVMAAELGPKQIRVGCILPGAVSTELNLRAGLFTADEADERYDAVAGLHALGRIGTGTEVAEGVEYLIRAEWVTGVALEVDGGIGLGVSHF